MGHRRTGLWFPSKILALERGDLFGDWTIRSTASGTWTKTSVEDYAHYLMNFRNNAGAGQAAAAYRRTFAQIQISNPTGYTAAHTVHMAVPTSSNRANYIAIAPATALHASSNAGNGYGVRAGFTGTPWVAIYKITNGTVTLLTISGVQAVDEGDVLSLAYRWNTASARAELAVLVNGTSIATFNDTSSPYDMASLTALPGMYGHDSPSLSNSLTIGQSTSEWWVTDGWSTWNEPQARYPAQVGELFVSVRKRQRYTDSAQPSILRMISGHVLSADWTVHRIGGCGQMRCKFAYPKPLDGVDPIEHEAYAIWQDPDWTNWTNNDWMGGEVLLSVKYQGDLTTQTGGTFSNMASTAMWLGRVARITSDPDTRTVELEADGLYKALDDVAIAREFTNATIRDIITTLIREHASKSGQSIGRDIPIKFNASKIVGLQSALDLRISIKFNLETAKGCIEKVMQYMPDGVLWGVDREGDFYLDQQLDTYDNDMSGSGFRVYQVDQHARRFERSVEVTKIKTQALVVGRELNQSEQARPALAAIGRITARAECERAEQLWGQRVAVLTDGSLADIGLAAKVAYINAKRDCLPAISGRLTVSERIIGDRSFWNGLTRFSPKVGVHDLNAINPEFSAPAAVSSMGGPNMLRRFGDSTAFSVKARGKTNGNYIELASTTGEQSLNKGWLIHASIRFDFAHSASTNDYLFGRTGGTDLGWGGLWWSSTGGGELYWLYTNSTGTNRTLQTGILTVQNDTKHVTVWRDAGGTFRFYNGTTLTATVSTFTGDTLRNNSAKWRWFSHDSGASLTTPTYDHGEFAIDQWYLLTTSDLSGLALEQQPAALAGVAGFIARNNDQELHRNDAYGLMLYFPFKGAHAGTVSITGWRIATTGATLVTATYSSTSATNGTAVTSTARTGVFLATAGEKKWGGPLIFNCEAARYSVEPSIGMVRIEFTLGEFRSDLFQTLQGLKDQAQRSDDALRRSRRDF